MEERAGLQEATVQNIKVVPLVPDDHVNFRRWICLTFILQKIVTFPATKSHVTKIRGGNVTLRTRPPEQMKSISDFKFGTHTPQIIPKHFFSFFFEK